MLTYIGIGSNLDLPENHVRRAIDELGQMPRARRECVSSLYRSAPLGPRDQDDFINAVTCLETELSADQLLDALKALELKHGRALNGRRWGPRPLDLDILLYGKQRIATERLSIPHPGLAERAFVLYPLAELDPRLEITGAGQVSELLRRCPSWDIERLS